VYAILGDRFKARKHFDLIRFFLDNSISCHFEVFFEAKSVVDIKIKVLAVFSEDVHTFLLFDQFIHMDVVYFFLQVLVGLVEFKKEVLLF